MAACADEGAAVITGNVVDFLELARERPEHHGLLLVYRRNDPRTDLRAAGIAAGVVSIASHYLEGIGGLILAVKQIVPPTEVVGGAMSISAKLRSPGGYTWTHW